MRQNDNESSMLGSGNEVIREGKGDLTVTLHKKEVEGIKSLLPSSKADEASFNRNQFGVECTDAQPHNPTDKSAETTSYLDKAVIQIELPDMIEFSEDSTIPVVKDICMDEVSEKTSVDKVLVGNEVSEKTNVSVTSMNNDLNGQMASGVPPDVQDSKFISANDKLIEDQNSSWSLSEVGEKQNVVAQVKTDNPVEERGLEAMLSPGDPTKDLQPANPTSCIDHEKVEQNKIEDTSSTATSLQPSTSECEKIVEVKQDPTVDTSKVSGDVSYSNSTDMISDARMSSPQAPKENPANGKGEAGINNPVESATTSTLEETRGSRDNQEILHAQICSVPEMQAPDTTITQPRSSFYHDNPGDLNFSGPKASSGHIVYSGNISMRSDSSTTSTRSFAFPILQTEWNTSPVKMAKAKKPRSWMGIICCKFCR